jgi:tetratricopeptide (TPR) repeat protein
LCLLFIESFLQTRVAIALLTQVIQQRNVCVWFSWAKMTNSFRTDHSACPRVHNHVGVSHSYLQSNCILISLRSTPLKPQNFFGRDAELAQIIDMVLTNVGSHPARVVILGPGGYGKTTLANAVLTDSRIEDYFGDARFFVACESIFSSGSLLIQLAKSTGIFKGGSEISWSQIHAALIAKQCILCLDNFESPWDQDGDTRQSVEELLSRITGIHSVTVLVTMRGTERPSQTNWTQPFLAPLNTLDRDSAKEIWKHISDNFDNYAEELMKAVDYVPLAITLLAHLAQTAPPSLLWEEWLEKQTGLVQRGDINKLSNLECSIQLSIDCRRMRAHSLAKELLGILSVLPDGIHIIQLKRFKEVLIGIDIFSSLLVLQQCSLISIIGERYQTHPIIRHFCINQGLVSSNYKALLQKFYITLASSDPFDAKLYDEKVLEVNNIKAILSDLLKLGYKDHTKLINAIINFTKFHQRIGDFSDKLICQTIQFIDERHIDISFLIQCLQQQGRLHYFGDDPEGSKTKLKKAESLCSASKYNGTSLHAQVLLYLSTTYLYQCEWNIAELTIQKALKFYKGSTDKVGEGNCYCNLAKIYYELKRMEEAEASAKRALKYHQAANDLYKANDHFQLGLIYLYQDNWQEAEESFKNALTLHTTIKDVLGQGNDYSSLGDLYKRLNKLIEAEDSYNKALQLHINVNDTHGQGIDHNGLGCIYLKQEKLDMAEASFQKALDCYKVAQDIRDQGITLYDLGEVYMKRSQVKDAQCMFEKAYDVFEKFQDVQWQEQSLMRINDAKLQIVQAS